MCGHDRLCEIWRSQTYVEIAPLSQSCGIVSEANEVDKGVVIFKYLNLAPKINTRKFVGL